MGKKLDRVYHALIDGATEGLAGDVLYERVVEKCPKTSSKRVVKAALLALSDPELKDRNILNTIYALAIEYRLRSLGVDEEDDDDDSSAAPSITDLTKKRLEASTVQPTQTLVDGAIGETAH
ncbi:hypothetical protein ACEQ6A_28535 [Rhizobium brockwellii]|uniref:hypothetical protein n=1 Tax=Rhizobium brockwellii TaxID=3019932 RepID=UPI003F96D613